MFLAILQAVQQSPVVTQAPQQIVVTIQQPPGPPEWAKVLLTAAVGAIIGVLSSLLTEYIKPYLTRAHEKKKLRQQIRIEMTSNVGILESIVQLLKDLDPENPKYAIDPMAPADASAVNLAYMKCVNLRWRLSSASYDRYVEDKEFWTFNVDKDEDLRLAYLKLADVLRAIDYGKSGGGVDGLVVLLIDIDVEAKKAIALFEDYIQNEFKSV